VLIIDNKIIWKTWNLSNYTCYLFKYLIIKHIHFRGAPSKINLWDFRISWQWVWNLHSSGILLCTVQSRRSRPMIQSCVLRPINRMIGRMILILIIALMMETVNTSEMLNYFYKTYRVQYPEGCHLKKCCLFPWGTGGLFYNAEQTININTVAAIHLKIVCQVQRPLDV
jgi:hypothetical protein